ncbi:WecB/TagA/CpsF family glycosyltransferase [Pseudoxanthomonas suwonensis]|uniref:Glycosyltransferase n=1 Tax=Pseudoxanthomonas suwonensis TaxID=314722 RepID=A0A0E3Z3N2_9GAMM|nr:WecB/TagA/CpsF family glycosyltransferase [Pseudoxanthomonas suwonensis]AKC86799.1 hypothetical protein WQ53_08555 [Pseudoxanthomonas suwonensis]
MHKKVDVIGAPINLFDWEGVITKISEWAELRQSKVVCICNAHSLVTAKRSLSFARIIRRADLATPDGMPVAWMLGFMTGNRPKRISGPDLMLRYCRHAAASEQSIYLYGGSQATLDSLVVALQRQFPGLIIAGFYSPPFRELTTEEADAVVDAINSSGANVVWVGLGCPKQELWMSENYGRVNAVMIGVGAAFDYHAGTLRRAPVWMQNCGLEWLYRLANEPRRLWKRYLVTNTLFIWYSARQLLSI